MSVYVDPLANYDWRLGPSCHLTADTIEELHSAAAAVGMKRAWFQDDGRQIPHYDLVGKRRILAVRNGAIEITRREMGERVMNHKKNRNK